MGDLQGLDFDARPGFYYGEFLLDAAVATGPSALIPVLVTDAAHNRLEIEVEVELDAP